MGEESVKIPVDVYVIQRSLNQLKSEVEKTFNKIHKYEQDRSTPRNKYEIPGIKETEARIDAIQSKIQGLINEYRTLGESGNPFSANLQQVEKDIEATKNGLSNYKKEIKQTKDEYEEFSKAANANKKALAQSRRQATLEEKNYKKELGKIDPTEKGAKAKISALEKSHQLKMQEISETQKDIEFNKSLNDVLANKAKARLEELETSKANEQNTLKELQLQKEELSQLANSEQAVANSEQERITRQKEILELIKSQIEAVNQLRTNAAEDTQHDKAISGYKDKGHKILEQTAKEEAKEEAQIQKELANTLRGIGKEVTNIMKDETNATKLSEKVAKEKAKAAVEAEKEAKKATQEQIAELNKEKSAVQQSTAQYYYKLRSVKMLQHVIAGMSATLNKFGATSLRVASKSLSTYLKLIPGVSRLQKALSKTSSSQRSFNNELKKTNKHSDGFNFSMKDAIKNLLKYGLGIRSLFVLFNKLRAAMVNGFKDMVTVFDPVNQSLSSISTSLLQMRNAVAAAVEPMLSVLAPALEKIANIVADVAYKVASFIAALTGRSMVIKATRAQVDYAKSLDKTGKSAKKAKQELAAFDDLDVLQKHDDGGDGMPDAGAMFEEVPIDETMKDWAEKFKEFLDKLMAPIMKAWDRVKDYVINGWKYMCQQLKALWADVARDFWRVWGEFKTEEMFRYIFLAIGDIMLIIGELAAKIREAWNYAESGYRILASIRDVGYEVAKHFREMTAYTRDWVQESLNLKPLFSAVADVMETQMVPAVRRVLDLFVMLYNNGFLELLRDFINTNLPVLVRGVGYFIDAFGIIAKHLQMALETGTKVGENIEYTRSRLDQILDKVEHFSHLFSESFKQMGEDFKVWAENLSFVPLFDSVIQFMENLTPLWEALFGKFEIVDGHMVYTEGLVNRLFNNAILPFWEYLIEDGGPRLIDILGKIFGDYDSETGLGIDWEHLTKVIGEFIDTLEPFFELAWETLIKLVEDLGKAFDDFVNSDSLDWIVKHFKKWVEDADPEDLAHKLETFAVIFIEVLAAFNLFNAVILPLIVNWMTFQNLLNNAQMNTTLGLIAEKMGVVTGEATAATGPLETLTGAFSKLNPVILIIVAVIAIMVASFGGLGNTLDAIKERVDTVAERVAKFAEVIDFSEHVQALKDKFGELQISLEGLRPVFELIFDVLAGLATIIINTVLGAIDGLVVAFGGIIDIVTGVADILSGFVALLTGDHLTAMNKFEEGIRNIFGGVLEIFEGIFLVGIPEAIGGFLSMIPGWEEIIKGFKDKVIGFFEDLKYRLIGDPIVYDIEDGVVEGFEGFMDTTQTELSPWVQTIVQGFEGLKTSVGEKVKSFKDGIVNKFNELKDGMLGKTDEAKQGTTDKFSQLSTDVSTTLDTNNLLATGEQFITGFNEGIDLTWPTLLENMNLHIAELLELLQTQFGYDMWYQLFSEGMLTAFTEVWTLFKSQFELNMGELFKSIQNHWKTMSTWFTNTWNKFTADWFAQFKVKWTTLSTWFTNTWNKYTSDWFIEFKRKWTTASTWFTNTWNKYTSDWFTELKNKWNKLDTWFNTTWDKAITTWFADTQKHWQNLLDWWDKSMNIWWINHVEPWFKEDKWLPQFENIYRVAVKVFTAIKEFISQKMQEARDFCVEMCEDMSESLRSTISLVEELIEKLEQLASMGGADIDVSFAGNAPHLAQGAVIPPNREFMAVLGDQTSGTNIETPLNTMLEAFRTVMDEYSSPRGAQNATMEVDGETFARLMLPYVMGEMHRQGYNTEIIEGT